MKTILVTLSVLAVPLAVPVGASQPVLEPIVLAVHDACRPGSNPVWLLSRQTMNETCADLYGRPGYQGVRPCQPPNPAAVGIPRALMQTAHERVKDTLACRPASDHLNATVVAERHLWNVTDALVALVDATCETSGGGDPGKGACGPLYEYPALGPVPPCDAPGCPWTPRALLDEVLG